MVAKERLPSLRGRARPPRHILGDAGLADLDAELEKLSMDSRRSPQRVGDAHLADQPANFQRCNWSAAAVPRFPAPIRSETGTVPTDAVSGFTIVSALMVFGTKRYSPTKNRRSIALKASLFGRCRRWI